MIFYYFSYSAKTMEIIKVKVQHSVQSTCHSAVTHILLDNGINQSPYNIQIWHMTRTHIKETCHEEKNYVS